MAVPLLFVNHQSASDLLQSTGCPIVDNQYTRDSGLYDYFSDLTDNKAVGWNDLKAGPSGSPGCVIGIAPPGQELESLSYLPDRQQWRQANQHIWIFAESTPQPAELQRHRVVTRSVQATQLANGSVWDIPVLRDPLAAPRGLYGMADLHSANLPSSFFKGVDGTWQSEVLNQYRELYSDSQKWFEFLVRETSGTFRFAEVFDYALSVMSLNYRYSHLLHSVYHDDWITTDNVWSVIRVSCGFDLLLAHHGDTKKKVAIQT